MHDVGQHDKVHGHMTWGSALYCYRPRYVAQTLRYYAIGITEGHRYMYYAKGITEIYFSAEVTGYSLRDVYSCGI